MYSGICNAGANWDNMSFNPQNLSDPDCKVDPDFHFLDNVDKQTPVGWNWVYSRPNGIYGFAKNN
jgi:hypothetical protein